MKSVVELQTENFETFLADGPRLSYKYHTWCVAKDSTKKKVLLGGLGGCGVGEMWFDMEDRHTEYPGFNEAPEITYVNSIPSTIVLTIKQ